MKTQEDFDGLVEVVKKHIPSFEVIQKKDSFLQKLIGVLLWPINQKYMTSYVSVMFGKMYMPGNASAWTYDSLYTILRHEFVHLLDAKAYPVLFELSYLLALPAVFTMRSFWELRGFTQTMLVKYEETGDIPDSTIEWILFQFVSSRYAWMNPFKSSLKKKLHKIRDDIKAGIIKGEMYPH